MYRLHRRLALLLLALSCSFAFGQCRSRVWESTSYPKGPAKFPVLMPAGMAERLAVNLTGNDWLVVYAKPGTRTPDDPQDGGFLVVRGHRVLVSQSLMQIPAWKKFARDIGPQDRPAFNVFVARVCSGRSPVFVLAFAACCSTASALQPMIVTPQGEGYRLRMLPMVGGGKLEVATGGAMKLSLWNERGDGRCDECLQHFDITDYWIDNGSPVLKGKQVSLEEHKPGEFASHRIVLVH
jgi:hypothetical protein